MILRQLIGLMLAALLVPATAHAQTWPPAQASFGPQSMRTIAIKELKFICTPRAGNFDSVEFVLAPTNINPNFPYFFRFIPKVGGQYLQGSFSGYGTVPRTFPVKPGTYDIVMVRDIVGLGGWTPLEWPTLVIPNVTVPNLLTSGGTACATPRPAGAPLNKILSLAMQPTNVGITGICERATGGKVNTIKASLNPREATGVYHFVFRNAATGVEHGFIESVGDATYKFPVPPGTYQMRVWYRTSGGTAPPVDQMHAYYSKIVVPPYFAEPGKPVVCGITRAPVGGSRG